MLASVLRRRRGYHDFADEHFIRASAPVTLNPDNATTPAIAVVRSREEEATKPYVHNHLEVPPFKAMLNGFLPFRASQRYWGREFRTSGNVILLLSTGVFAIEAALFALILNLPPSQGAS